MLPALLLILAACGPKLPPESALDQPPRLPAPRAARYASVEAEPSDPVIALLARGHTWNETLSGAAAGLALAWAGGQGKLAAWEVREAAWQAGWPWPIDEVRGWMTAQRAAPPEELIAWLDARDPSVPLGLVRARGIQGDAWVALTGTPRDEVPALPRQVELGGQLTFPAQPGVELTVADPVGGLSRLALDEQRVVHADVAGEWLFELRRDDALLALFPVYVAMVPPEAPVLTDRGRPTSEQDALEGFQEVLTEIREVYGLPDYRPDPLLAAAARAAAHGRVSDTMPELARRLGYDPARAWKITCRARTLADCADKLLWNPRARPALLARDADAGLGASIVPDGVHVVVLVGAR